MKAKRVLNFLDKLFELVKGLDLEDAIRELALNEFYDIIDADWEGAEK